MPQQRGVVRHGVRLEVLLHRVGEWEAVDAVDGRPVHDGVSASLVQR